MIRMKRLLILQVFGALIAAMAQGATNFDLAAQATNELAVDLHRQLATGNENLCVSPLFNQNRSAHEVCRRDRQALTEEAGGPPFSDQRQGGPNLPPSAS